MKQRVYIHGPTERVLLFLLLPQLLLPLATPCTAGLTRAMPGWTLDVFTDEGGRFNFHLTLEGLPDGFMRRLCRVLALPRWQQRLSWLWGVLWELWLELDMLPLQWAAGARAAMMVAQPEACPWAGSAAPAAKAAAPAAPRPRLGPAGPASKAKASAPAGRQAAPPQPVQFPRSTDPEQWSLEQRHWRAWSAGCSAGEKLRGERARVAPMRRLEVHHVLHVVLRGFCPRTRREVQGLCATWSEARMFVEEDNALRPTAVFACFETYGEKDLYIRGAGLEPFAIRWL